jgi:hypothetical protein
MQAFYPPHSGYHRQKYFWGENSNYKRFILGNIQPDEFLKLPIFSYEDGGRAANVPHRLTVMITIHPAHEFRKSVNRLSQIDQS